MRPSEGARRGRLPATADVVMLAALTAWASGVLWRPSGTAWEVIYDVLLYHLVYVAGALICWQARTVAPRQALVWRATAAALACHVLGDLTISVLTALNDQGVAPTLSVADVFYLGGYPLIYLSLYGLVRARVHQFHASMWLDGIVGALGAAALTVAAVLGSSLHVGEVSLSSAVNVAYPVGDLLMLVLLVGVCAVLGLRLDRVLTLLGVGLVCGLIADVAYAQQAESGTYQPGGWLDLVWLLTVPAVALAARHVLSNPEAANAEPARLAGNGWRVLALPMAGWLVSICLLGLGWGNRFSPLAAVCAIGCVLAGMARLAMTFREVRALADAREQAMTDELTGLPNRRALLAVASTTLAGAGDGRPCALLLLDLDGFKDVNDGLGHHAGDTLLRLIARRLLEAITALDGSATLARLGGDEFAALLPGTGLAVAAERARGLREALGAPFALDGVRVHVGASIGVATAGSWASPAAPREPLSVIELLRRADIAMYAAKRSGCGVHAFTPRTDGATGDRLRIMDELHTALDTDQLVIHLQPQVRAGTGAPYGVEALVRWVHPTRGLLCPADLLPAATQAGLLLPLADRVMDLALAAAAGWWPQRQIPVSVNLAAPNVTDVDLPAKVAAALARHGLPPAALTLELVEDMLMADPARGCAVLERLQKLGVRTSMDDYGTGYSSLAYLRNLPIDELKLDRAFTADLRDDRRARAVVDHTVALGHALDLTVVAEGVEDQDTLDLLTTLGCDVAQGFLISRPLPVAEFRAWLDAASTPARVV